MKKAFLTLPILVALAFGQSVVEPILVSITTSEKDSDDRAVAKQFRIELTRAGRVAIVSERARMHFNFVVAASPVATVGPCAGYTSAIVASSARVTDRLILFAGASHEQLARIMAEKLEADYFHVDVNGDGRIGSEER